MESLKTKLRSLKNEVSPFVDQALTYSKKHPLAAAGIAAAAIGVSYGISFAVQQVRNGFPNIRMISISKKIENSSNDSDHARPLIVLIHGWPDFADSWGNVVNALFREYDLLLIELPNYNNNNISLDYLFGYNKETKKANTFPLANYYDILYHISNNQNGIIVTSNDESKVPSSAYNSNKWGWNTPIVVDSIHEAIGNYISTFRQNYQNNDKITLLIHDWGAATGMSLYHTMRKEANGLTKSKQRFKITRIATIDIGDKPDIKTLGHALFFVTYQWYNIASYLIPWPLSFIGNAMGRAPISTLFFLAPMARQKRVYSGFSREMNYMYFWMWHFLLFGKFYGLIGARKFVPFTKMPHVPVFFGYAGLSALKFHGKDTWGKELLKRNEMKGFEGTYIYNEYPNSVHWVHCENTKDIAQFNEDLIKWLKITDGKELVFQP